MNIFEQALINGFTADVKFYNPKNNFFGASIRHPDVTLQLGEKFIIISCGGVNMDDRYLQSAAFKDKKTSRFQEFKANHKMIKLISNDQEIYYTHSGILPGDKIVEKFFKVNL